jgi:outer membrane protein OmpA-like peptidoglycan-associated protein
MRWKRWRLLAAFALVPGAAQADGSGNAETEESALLALDDPRPDGARLPDAGAPGPGADADGDHRPDAEDLDDDGDGILDPQESAAQGDVDADSDGLPNHLDLDADADGLYDADESGHDAADKNADGRVDGALGQNGVADLVESRPDSGRVAAPRDSDADGVPDFLDRDSDDDGTEDSAEAGDDRLATLPEDTDADGDPDLRDDDDDGDGVPSRDERNERNPDSDGDGRPDPRDDDDDDDGIPTRSERPDQLDRNSDADGIPDHLDADDDGDGTDTRGERTDQLEDLDSDGDGTPDHLDTDDDGDGILTREEPGDRDGDGVPDRLAPPPVAISGGALCSAHHGPPGQSGLGWFMLGLCLAVLAVRGRSARFRALCTLALGLLALAAPAQAQVALEQFKPAPIASDGFGIARPGVLPRGSWSTQLWIDYANDPLVAKTGTGSDEHEEKVVEHHLVGHVGFGVGVARRFTLFASLPVHILMEGDKELSGGVPAPDGDGLGDLVVGGRIQLSGLDPKARFASALELIARPPTAELFNKQQSYSGDAIGSYEPALSGEVRAGRFDVRLRAGARLRREETIGDLRLGHELIGGLGMRLRLVDGLHLHAEGLGSTFLAEPFKSRTSPVETLFGIKYQGDALVIGAAAGPGLSRGFGTPDVRVVSTLGYAPREKPKPVPKDSDGDGLLDPKDRCPREPEDVDGFEDQDGCPELDNDGDGVHDSQDSCVDEPEDTDDFEDADGCPDPDNDKDGVPDLDDACPLEPEDTDGFEDQDGCAEADNDKDGLADLDDHCPEQAEDVDGFEDQDGCPEPGGGLVKITCTRIEIGEMVYFDTGKDTIQPRSFALLDQVASVLIGAKHILRLRVAGHSDDRGNDKRNLELSMRRAASVERYLVVHGVESGRLSSEGYGETEPIASNKTAEGRAKNRRVEFQILEQATDCKGP